MAQLLVQLHHYLQIILQYGIQLYSYALIAYFLMSWLPGAYQSALGQFMIKICEPYVGIFRRFIPPIGMISLAGMVAFFALRFLGQGASVLLTFVLNMLLQLVYALGLA